MLGFDYVGLMYECVNRTLDRVLRRFSLVFGFVWVFAGIEIFGFG